MMVVWILEMRCCVRLVAWLRWSRVPDAGARQDMVGIVASW